MHMSAKRAAIRFLLFALLGLLIEVFFTALGGAFRGNWNITGHTSPWMMIDYGLLGVILMPIARPLTRLGVPLPGRAVAYMIAIFFVEFVSGTIFTACGLHIWNYEKHALNLNGQITLMYAPFWYALGLGVEMLYRKIDAIAVMLLKGITAEQLEQLDPA